MTSKDKTAYIATGIMGAVAFDSSGKVVDRELFPKDAAVIAEKLSQSRSGKLIDEESTLVKRLKTKGIDAVKAGDDSDAAAKMRDEFRTIALQLKWAGSQAEINAVLSAVGAAMAKPKLQEVKSDRILMSAIGVSDELDRVINIFVERLREWYGFHFPEGVRAVADHEKFVGMAAQGFREDVKVEGNDDIEKLASNSAGMDFSEDDMAQVKAFAESTLRLFELRDGMRGYIDTSARRFAPNTAAIAGPALALRLLVLAGGLDKLAKMPSSTIQMLGAEKALFRHLKGQGRSPKHGILFSHEMVQNAPHDLKGKVARLVAAKLALASRVDYFSKEDRSAKMRAELDEEVKKASGSSN
jgi:nucleolar protein 56